MLGRQSIAAKIALAVALFGLPVAFILWLLAATQGQNIEFAAREAAGVRALGALLSAEHALDRAILGGPAAGKAVTLFVQPQVAAFARLGLQRERAALLAAANGDAATVRDLLRRVVVAVGDRSNLILDNVLDTYYLTDVVLNRLPDLLDGIAGLRALAASQGRSADARVAFLLAQGSLDGVVGGLDGSMHATLAANQVDKDDGILPVSLAGRYSTLKDELQGFAAALRAGGAMPDAAHFRNLLGDSADFGAAGTEALRGQLDARVARLTRERVLDFAVTFVLFGAAAAATMLMIRAQVLRRVNRLRNVMQLLASDRDPPDVPYREDRDEIGDMARTVEVFRTDRQERIRLLEETSAAQRARVQMQKSLDENTVSFGTAVAGTMAGLAVASNGMCFSAEGLLTIAESTNDEVRATAAATGESAKNLAAVAASVEQMAASAAEITRQVGEAAGVTHAAVSRTEATDAVMATLAAAAERIGVIAVAIGDIAERTNLLALNASIEALRAGSAGRGFAVVAAEVKQLAGQTAMATDEIVRQIAAIQSATGGAVAAMQEISAAIRQVDGVAASIAGAAGQQGATTQDIAGRVHLVAEATTDSAGRMDQVLAAADEARVATEAVAAAAASFASRSNGLRTEVEDFLAAMTDAGKHGRRYERYRLIGVQAVVTIGDRTVDCMVEDIALGGFAIRPALPDPVGTDVSVLLPGETAAMMARIARNSRGSTGLCLRQDAATRAAVGAAIARLVNEARSAA